MNSILARNLFQEISAEQKALDEQVCKYAQCGALFQLLLSMQALSHLDKKIVSIQKRTLENNKNESEVPIENVANSPSSLRLAIAQSIALGYELIEQFTSEQQMEAAVRIKKIDRILTYTEPSQTSEDESVSRMWKNAKKAIEEHLQTTSQDALAPLEEALPTLESLRCLEAYPECLTGEITLFSSRGRRNHMEDFSFTYRLTTRWLLMGVFDGHGGTVVSKYLQEHLAQKFVHCQQEHPGDMRYAIEQALAHMSKTIQEKTTWRHVGSTALFSVVDLSCRKVYTATVGDSEACIYREYGEAGSRLSIPLSPLRNWRSPKEAARAALVLMKPQIATEWPLSDDPKSLRFPEPDDGVNLSRALGDDAYRPGVSSKPKITMQECRPGDILILATDGFKDFVSERETIDLIGSAGGDSKSIANALGSYALKEKMSDDNITILALKIG